MEKPDYRIEKIVGDEYVKFSSVNLDNMQYDCFLNICLCVDVDDCESYYPSDNDCNKYCKCVSEGNRDTQWAYRNWTCECDFDDCNGDW